MFCARLRAVYFVEMVFAIKILFLMYDRLLAVSAVGNASGVRLARIMRRQTMIEMIENKMVVDAAWDEDDSRYDDLPRCECCEEKIKQYRALHILSGKKRVWICDRCIEDMKEVTGW